MNFELDDDTRLLQRTVREFALQEIKPVAEEVYASIESPKGELGFYCVSNGSNKPYRMHVRPRTIDPGMDEDLLRHVEVVAALDLVAVEVDTDHVIRRGVTKPGFAGPAGSDQQRLRSRSAGADVSERALGQFELAEHPARFGHAFPKQPWLVGLFHEKLESVRARVQVASADAGARASLRYNP